MKSPASCSEHVPVVVTEDIRCDSAGKPVARLITVECLECAIRLDVDPYFRLELEEAA